MKQKSIFIFLMLGSQVFFNNVLAVDGRNPLPVSKPDLPDNGWYWAAEQGGVPGWGLNLECQTADFSATGLFCFGAVYTYKPDGSQAYYTFQGDYQFNSDVWAWREKRGDMGSITATLYETANGGCLTCPQVAADGFDAGLGALTVTWNDPINAVVSLNGVQHQVNRFRFHSGLPATDISFITKGWWQVYWQDSFFGNSENERWRSARGLVRFEELDKSKLIGSPFHNENWLYFINTTENSLEWRENDCGYSCNTYASSYSLLIAYDPLNQDTYFFRSLDSDDNLIDDLLHLTCDFLMGGKMRPESSKTNVFYAISDDRCISADKDTEERRRNSYLYMTNLGNVGEAVVNKGAFLFNNNSQ